MDSGDQMINFSGTRLSRWGIERAHQFTHPSPRGAANHSFNNTPSSRAHISTLVFILMTSPQSILDGIHILPPCFRCPCHLLPVCSFLVFSLKQNPMRTKSQKKEKRKQKTRALRCRRVGRAARYVQASPSRPSPGQRRGHVRAGSIPVIPTFQLGSMSRSSSANDRFGGGGGGGGGIWSQQFAPDSYDPGPLSAGDSAVHSNPHAHIRAASSPS